MDRTWRDTYRPLLRCPPPTNPKPWGFLSVFYGIIMLSSFIGLLYLLYDYTWHSKYDLQTMNKSIADVAKKMAIMKSSYYDLESKILRFSQELPKIGGQLEILEAIAKAIKRKEIGWDPKNHCPLPNVTVFLKNELGKNVTSIR